MSYVSIWRQFVFCEIDHVSREGLGFVMHMKNLMRFFCIFDATITVNIKWVLWGYTDPLTKKKNWYTIKEWETYGSYCICICRMLSFHVSTNISLFIHLTAHVSRKSYIFQKHEVWKTPTRSSSCRTRLSTCLRSTHVSMLLTHPWGTFFILLPSEFLNFFFFRTFFIVHDFSIDIFNFLSSWSDSFCLCTYTAHARFAVFGKLFSLLFFIKNILYVFSIVFLEVYIKKKTAKTW